MPSLEMIGTEVENSVVTEVPVGNKAVLNCTSNDLNHNFMFWLSDKIPNRVIGPSNDFDERKYNYEVLSGRLHIDSVTASESGLYGCVSQSLNGSAITVGEVKMIVTGSTFSTADTVKLIAVIVSITVLIICAVIYFHLRKEWRKRDGQIMTVDDDDEDGDNEIYNKTTTSISQPVPGPSRNHSSEQLIYGIDNQGLDTDFNSVFENIQIKSPQSSLI